MRLEFLSWARLESEDQSPPILLRENVLTKNNYVGILPDDGWDVAGGRRESAESCAVTAFLGCKGVALSLVTPDSLDSPLCRR